jgi:hypothetical protein
VFLAHEGADIRGAALWRFETWPTGSRFRCLALYGKGMADWFDDMERAVKAVASKPASGLVDPWDDVARNFGYPCGKSFTSDRHKCYVDPKTGVRLKKPITRQIYDKIMKSGGKAAQTLYKDREDRIRASRRDRVKGWKKDLSGTKEQKNTPQQQSPIKAYELTKQELTDRIKAAPDNLYETQSVQDWGTGRGQGRRRGGAVQGAMSGLARGKVTYIDIAGKLDLNKDEKFDFGMIPDKAAQGEYAKGRAAGLNHEDAMMHVDGILDPKLDTHKIAVKKALDRGDKVPDSVLKEYPDLAKKVAPKLTLDKVETSLDREKFAEQQLADAKARGDKKDIKSWEEQTKATRKARLNESISKTKQTQGTLFDTTVMDDSPLMRKLREQGDFGYACGKTFIPDAAKCYTDPKTGVRLRVPLTKQQVERARSKSPGAERLYSQQEQQIKDRLRGGVIPPEFQAAARSTGATKVLPSGIAEVNPKNLHLDPKRFQYKLVSGSTGESGSLTGVKKWDANLAGVQLAWHDPADQKTYVINGHNRTNLAKKLGVDSVTTRFIKANTAKEARAIGAVTNVAEGNGTSLDAAKFFRDSNLTQDDLVKKGIPLKSSVATEGVALAKLNDGLFNKVVQGDLSKERGVIIGKNLTDHKEQSELVDLIDKQEKKGKKITNEGIAELTEMVQSAPKQQADGGFLGMLGFSPEARSLAVEKAEIQAHIKRQLSTDKKLFGTVGRGRNAAKLERGGNTIDVDRSSQISAEAERALRNFDREKRYSGKTADAINLAAERIAKGEKAAKVKEETYAEILKLIK